MGEVQTTTDDSLSLGNSGQNQVLKKLEIAFEDINALVACKICTRPMYEPYITSCGHSFCYSCLVHWFTTHRREKTCPSCRAKVTKEPTPEFTVKDIVHILVSRVELLEPGDTLESLRKDQEEEARLVEQDKTNQDTRTGGLFRGCFSDRPPRPVIHDSADGVYRCPACTWELEHGWCRHCETIYDVEQELASITDLSDSTESENYDSDEVMEHGPWGDLNSLETDVDDISLDGDGRSVHAYDLDLEFAIGRTAAQDLQGHQTRRRASHGGPYHHHGGGHTPSMLSTATNTDYSEVSDVPGDPYIDGFGRGSRPDQDLTDYSENSDDPDTDLDGFILNDGTEANAEDVSLHFSSDVPSDGSSDHESVPEIQARRRPIVELSDSSDSENKYGDGSIIRPTTRRDGSPGRQSIDGENDSSAASDTSQAINTANVSRKRRRIITEEASDNDEESDPSTQRSHSRRRLSSDGSATIGSQTPTQNTFHTQRGSRPTTSQNRGGSDRPRQPGATFRHGSETPSSGHERHVNSSNIPPRDMEDHTTYRTQPLHTAGTFMRSQPATSSSRPGVQRNPPPVLCRRGSWRAIQRNREGNRSLSMAHGNNHTPSPTALLDNQ